MDQCHIDPVYKTIWINAKAGTEFFTASTDGMVSYIIFKISTFPFVETERWNWLYASLTLYFVCQKYAITFHESISIIYIYIWIAILIALFSLSNVTETNKKDLGNVIVVCGRHLFLFSRQKTQLYWKTKKIYEIHII